ncbi:MAG TPA: alpha/beta fold hydrolase [Solirubrobacteraceae bacterium]|nr:alpha/beta fold hydrolase [Solirubrobacteraceae bacterium]
MSVLAALGLCGLTAGPALARDGTVTSFDGTKIAYHFYPRPGLAPGQRAPTLMDGPGYSSGGASESDATVQAALNDGYNVLTWDPRGFGQSGGQVEIDSPMYEARDASALIDMLAQQPEVQLDKPGDPHLGMIGASYGGGIQLVTAATDPRVDAITPQIAWNSLITSLDKSNTAKGGWGSLLVALGTAGSTTGVTNDPAGFGPTGRQDPHTTSAFADGLSTGEFTAADQAYFAARGPDFLLSRIHVPTLLMQGTDDTLFTLHEAIANFKALQANGVPVQMLWFCGGLTGGPVAHGVCNTPVGPDPHIDTDYALRWLDHYLKGTGTVGPTFSWVSDAGVLRGAPDYPPAQGTPVTASGSGTLVMTPGDVSGALIEAQPAVNALNVGIPTPATGTELLGEPTLTLGYSGTAANPDARVYAQIVDNASHLVLGNQATPIPLTLDGAAHTLSIPLEAVAADVTAGTSYTLQLTDGSDLYFAARQPGLVTFSSVKLSIPTVAVSASAGAGHPVAPPPVTACPASTGRVHGRVLGPITIGMTRRSAKRALRFSATRGRRDMDFFCLSPNGIRVGYPSARLLRTLPQAIRRRVRGRAVLVLTANRRYAVNGVRPDTRLARVARRLHTGRGFHVGRNDWYFFSRRGANGILKVRHGVIEEVGLADRTLAAGRARQRRFVHSFS